MSGDIEARIKEIICEQLDVKPDDVSDAKSFTEDFGADSLAIVELVLAFEEDFEIDIPDEETERIRTVQNAVEYIASRVNQGRPTASA